MFTQTSCLMNTQKNLIFQIYIYRHNSHDTTDMNVSNHTVFHSLFRKPYGYPRNRKPITVTEGTISYCWDERADKQVSISLKLGCPPSGSTMQLFLSLPSYSVCKIQCVYRFTLLTKRSLSSCKKEMNCLLELKILTTIWKCWYQNQLISGYINCELCKGLLLGRRLHSNLSKLYASWSNNLYNFVDFPISRSVPD